MQFTRVLGVLKGMDYPAEQILAWAKSAQLVYAADGAARTLIEAGLAPVVVGDLDSLDRASIPKGVRVVHDPDQETTDCDKLITLMAAEGVTCFTLAGLEGDRLDHVFASLCSLVGRRMQIRVLLRRGMGFIVPCGENFRLNCPSGTRFSVLPLTLCWGVNLTNAEWSMTDAELRPGLHVSISNRSGEDTQLFLAGGTALVVIEGNPGEPPHWED